MCLTFSGYFPFDFVFKTSIIICDVTLTKPNQPKKMIIWWTCDQNDRLNNDSTELYWTHAINTLIIKIPSVTNGYVVKVIVECAQLVQTHSTRTYAPYLRSKTEVITYTLVGPTHNKWWIIERIRKERDDNKKLRKNLVRCCCVPAMSTNHVRTAYSREKKTQNTRKRLDPLWYHM